LADLRVALGVVACLAALLALVAAVGRLPKRFSGAPADAVGQGQG
jgi:hypothetical protein